ncbi:MAG TPA: ATP-binding protein [Caulobacteraceae bacterium]|jgi:signal transduction histidine kinase/CheY-like chemotaxis protein|nr:ATP-binding protein [Caulobacteraceae bacterium]
MAEREAGLGAAPPTDAAQVMQTILQTQYVRYWLIGSWAVGLWPTAGWATALIWFVLTMAAGGVRGWFERRLARRVTKDLGVVFQAVALITGAFWAAAPILAWISPHPFGQELAIGYLACGYLLVFTQLRHSPKQAFVISSPYTLVSVWMASTLWGTHAFWSFLAILPFMWSGLGVHLIVGLVSQAKITAFQNHQSHLIEELETARDRADAANKAKSAFLGVISHELRTPMNGVLGAAQLLSATRLDGTQKEYVSIVRNSGDNLLALLNDILDLTKIEADRMALEAIEIDVHEIVERVGGTWSARATEKQIDYAVAVAEETPSVVVGDPTRLSQIVHNLLSNAIKFTERGAVSLKVSAERLAETRARLTFRVSDTGPGIAAEDVERLFQPFTQLDASSTRRFGGTGLGLTICRRLAGLMGGELSVESEVGKGSTFILTIETDVRAWAQMKIDEEVTAEIDQDRVMRVLVVEDHPVNRMIIEAWLTSAGHAAVSAENGEAALALMAEQAFDLILMDVNMPVMDGLTATRRLRESHNSPNQESPVVVLSASARAEDHEAGYAAGADAYLNKPIDFKALASVLNRAAFGGRERLREAA